MYNRLCQQQNEIASNNKKILIGDGSYCFIYQKKAKCQGGDF